jgi:hypothetical protein
MMIALAILMKGHLDLRIRRKDRIRMTFCLKVKMKK